MKQSKVKIAALSGLTLASSITWADNLTDSNSIWLDYGRVEKVCVSDFDQDGDLDLFKVYSGVVTRLENIGTIGSPLFSSEKRVLDNPSGYTVKKISESCSGFSSSQWVDIDADGDLDLFKFGFAYRGLSWFIYSMNNGSTEQPVYVAGDLSALGLKEIANSRNILFVDTEGDGDFDFFYDQDYYENQGTASSGRFIKQASAPFDPYCEKVGNNPPGYGLFMDFNHDGRVDKICVKNGGLEYMASSLSGFSSVDWDVNKDSEIIMSDIHGLQSLDIDSDGDMDVLSHMANYAMLYTNISTQTKPQFNQRQVYTRFPEEIESAVFADLDGDGDLDYLFKAANSSVGLELAINTGSTSNPQYLFQNTPSSLAECNKGLVDNEGGKNVASMVLTDIDGDGDLDLLSKISTISPPRWGDYMLAYCENKGTLKEPLFSTLQANAFGVSVEDRHVMSHHSNWKTSLFFEDKDGDGDQDLWAYDRYFENKGDSTSPLFTQSTEAPYASGGKYFIPTDTDHNGLVDSMLSSGVAGSIRYLYQDIAPEKVKQLALNGSIGAGEYTSIAASRYDSFTKLQVCSNRYISCSSAIKLLGKVQEISLTKFPSNIYTARPLKTVVATTDIFGKINVKLFDINLRLTGEVDSGVTGHSLSMAQGYLDGFIEAVITFVDENNHVIAAIFDFNLSVKSVIDLGEGKQPHVSSGRFLGKGGFVVSYLTLNNQLKISTFLGDGTLVGEVDGGMAKYAKVSTANLIPSTVIEDQDDEYVVSIIQPDGKASLLGFTSQGVLLGKITGGVVQQPTVISGRFFDSADGSDDGLAVSIIQEDNKPAVIFLDNKGNYIATGVGEKKATEVSMVSTGIMGVVLVYIDEEGRVHRETFRSDGSKVK